MEFPKLGAKDIKRIANKVFAKYPHDLEYATRFLEDVLDAEGLGEFSKEELATILSEHPAHLTRARLKITGDDSPRSEAAATAGCEELANTLELDRLRREIIDYYFPKQLFDVIAEHGTIPKDSVETSVGVGFIDIADYSYLAKFLSPKENQILLNGLYTAFSAVLSKHGGFLNKTEGDSIMFQFGGIEKHAKHQTHTKDPITEISHNLFYTCVEMQRVCGQFNRADPLLLKNLPNQESRDTVQRAFDIIANLRNDPLVSGAFNALFQIRIRIGANVGEVSIGNFGPPGSKRWDVIGIAVIDAKRMESTAPIGGLRISESFYQILLDTGVVDAYYEQFKKEATEMQGYYKDIAMSELFSFGEVVLRDKKNVVFRTYSVQVDPGLPEAIQDQVALLLQKNSSGAHKIVEFVQYYRGNRHIVQAIEDKLQRSGVVVRKEKILRYLDGTRYRRVLEKFGGNKSKTKRFIRNRVPLYSLFRALGSYQDNMKQQPSLPPLQPGFNGYESFMSSELAIITAQYKAEVKHAIQRTYFFRVVFPLVFKSMLASILEFQLTREIEESTELEVIL